ncbi:MAG: hypothetical protein HQL67_08180 [Magnetococcales bacterium]|nr:hypothetical protein [Magnetococcales bacterium]
MTDQAIRVPSIGPISPKTETVTLENFDQIWTYILIEVESGRWQFADWPLETLQEIPLKPDPQGQAIQDLTHWINRHLKPETRQKMFDTVNRKEAFESKKAATEILLSEKSRDRLLHYRETQFGEGKGSMELAIRQLLDGVERTLSQETFQKLVAFQREQKLASPQAAMEKLFERARQPQLEPGKPDETGNLKQEINALLTALKGDESKVG